MNDTIEVSAKKVYKRKLFIKIIKIVFLLLIISLSIFYLALYVVYDGGRFTVSLDKNLRDRKNIFLSEDGKTEGRTIKLSADTIDYMDNISVKWLPEDIDKVSTGSHNGDNFIAYTFYIINLGKQTINYWYEIDIDDTVKNVDEAIRVMVYQNGKPIIYAKPSKIDGKAEEGTVKFQSDDMVCLEKKEGFKPGDKDRYTVVVWIEGDDPECKNDLLGGEIKMHMDFIEEHVDNK